MRYIHEGLELSNDELSRAKREAGRSPMHVRFHFPAERRLDVFGSTVSSDAALCSWPSKIS